jgi:hypothetical protein
MTIEIQALVCPICGGPFLNGTGVCSYCGCGLLYEEIIIEKEKDIIPNYKRKRLILNGIVVHELRKISYMGCPKCYKKAKICEHFEKPVKLFWRTYLVIDNTQNYTIMISPEIGELKIGKIYTFDVFEKETGDFVLTAIDEQITLRATLENKSTLINSLASKGYSLEEIKKVLLV